MAIFEDRKTAAEAKFKNDQEFQFKVIARRNRLLGLWAAEQMGMSGADAEAYAKQVVIADFEEPGDADVLRKVLGDLTGRGIETDEHKVRHEMTRLLEEAKTQASTELDAGFDRIECDHLDKSTGRLREITVHRQPKVRLTKRETEICSHEFSGRRSNGFEASVQKHG